jgi:hypothetical protein
MIYAIEGFGMIGSALRRGIPNFDFLVVCEMCSLER